MNANPKILIVGSGPSGLIIALALCKNGIPVRIIEKSPTAPNTQRGPGIMPRTQELFKALGILEEVYKERITVPTIRTYRPQEGFKVPLYTVDMAPPMPPTPSCPILSIACVGQNRLESVLRTALKKYSCEVEFARELVTLSQDADGVDATILHADGKEEIQRYDFVVGADGGRGVVRKQLGLSFLGESRPMIHLLIGDLLVEGVSSDYWHMWGDLGGDCVFLRPTETPGLMGLMMGTKSHSDSEYQEFINDRAALEKTMRTITGVKDLTVTKVVGLAQWKANIRMVDKFRVGRCFVVGDAAHVHSPTGGQGLNSGAQDGFNLGWKLALVQRGLAPMALLDSYNEERLPVVTEMLAATTRLLNRTVEVKADSKDVSHWDRGGPLLMLGVNYRWSSIVLDERDEGSPKKEPKDAYGMPSSDLWAGDRAPDAPALKEVGSGKSEVHLFDVFDASRHTVLIFSASPERNHEVIESLAPFPQDAIRCVSIVRSDAGTAADTKGPALILEDTLGHAYSNYHFKGEYDIAVIRPDGVLGAVVGGGKGLGRYFRQIFLEQ